MSAGSRKRRHKIRTIDDLDSALEVCIKVNREAGTLIRNTHSMPDGSTYDTIEMDLMPLFIEAERRWDEYARTESDENRGAN